MERREKSYLILEKFIALMKEKEFIHVKPLVITLRTVP
jgi:hypothetical protein